MFRILKKILYVLVILNILALIWGRFFNPIITWTQIEGLILYQKLDRDYVDFNEMGSNVKKPLLPPKIKISTTIVVSISMLFRKP